jgi:hypothetical protein
MAASFHGILGQETQNENQDKSFSKKRRLLYFGICLVLRAFRSVSKASGLCFSFARELRYSLDMLASRSYIYRVRDWIPNFFHNGRLLCSYRRRGFFLRANILQEIMRGWSVSGILEQAGSRKISVKAAKGIGPCPCEVRYVGGLLARSGFWVFGGLRILQLYAFQQVCARRHVHGRWSFGVGKRYYGIYVAGCIGSFHERGQGILQLYLSGRSGAKLVSRGGGQIWLHLQNSV